jgi:AraC family transcriptional regulator
VAVVDSRAAVMHKSAKGVGRSSLNSQISTIIRAFMQTSIHVGCCARLSQNVGVCNFRSRCCPLPALSHPDQANLLFLDHVLLGVGVHVAQTYGGMRPMSQPPRGGLAPWQERRAMEILRANIKRGVALREVARECGLSVGYFSHSFRRSLGVASHKWLIEQRVVLSKEKLRDDGLSLSDVATECGFSDQSHLTRVFRQTVGVSPGAWRRALQR